MNASRIGATATLLNDGRVLIAGGISRGAAVASAEIFSPYTGLFTPTGSMLSPRAYQTATLLPDGRVLMVGGTGTHAAEIYNPTTGKFGKTATMKDNVKYQAAVGLLDGRVFIAGGISSVGYTARAEYYNPSSGKFVRARGMAAAREHPVAALLPDGRVLVAGGDNGDSGKHPVVLSSAEIYNPNTSRFTKTGSMNYGRSHFAAVTLQSGLVLVMGGINPSAYAGILATAELFDPSTGHWTPTGSMNIGRSDFTATLLPDGRVLVAGGGDNTTELYDPATGQFTMGPLMIAPRVSQTTTLLADNRLLMAGGNVFGDNGAEFYNP
jgi:WD40 repeat protein